jgi:hypothetical protein
MAAYDDEPQAIDLEQSEQLRQTQILSRCIFYTKDTTLDLLLNHQYDRKSVVVKIDIQDWNNASEVFERQLRRKGIKQEHVLMLLDLLDENHHVIITQGQHSTEEEQDEGPKETVAQIALGLAGEHCFATFMDQFGTPHAAVEVGDHIETLPMKSSRFRNWLCRIFYNSEGKLLTGENVTNVISLLKARAEFDSEVDTRNLNLRVSSRPEENHTIYYDLTNKNWEFVKITPKKRQRIFWAK